MFKGKIFVKSSNFHPILGTTRTTRLPPPGTNPPTRRTLPRPGMLARPPRTSLETLPRRWMLLDHQQRPLTSTWIRSRSRGGQRQTSAFQKHQGRKVETIAKPNDVIISFIFSFEYYIPSETLWKYKQWFYKYDCICKKYILWFWTFSLWNMYWINKSLVIAQEFLFILFKV